MYTPTVLLEISDKMSLFASLLYLLAMVFYIFYIVFKNKIISYAATFTGWTAFILHIISFITRWIEFNKYTEESVFMSLPVTNLYESLIFFSMLLAGIYLVLEIKTKNRSLGAFAFALAGTVSLFVNAIGLSSNLNPLVPALKSNWLLAHVSLSFTGYVCFAVSGITALLYLIITVDNKRSFPYILYTFVLSLFTSLIISLSFNHFIKDIDFLYIYMPLFILFFLLFYIFGERIKHLFSYISYSAESIESITYKFSAAGFAIFTIGGIVFGAVWAEKSWGRYWSWDPKETWSFITWVVYGIYLHGRLSGRWTKNTAACIALIGFLITVFTYLGVNILLSGLHSYGSLG